MTDPIASIDVATVRLNLPAPLRLGPIEIASRERRGNKARDESWGGDPLVWLEEGCELARHAAYDTSKGGIDALTRNLAGRVRSRRRARQRRRPRRDSDAAP